MPGGQPPDPAIYWRERADALYLQYVYFIARVVAVDAKSILDVGSYGCPYIEWFDWIPEKVSLDERLPYQSDGVRGITADFLTADLEKTFDLCLCLQVLEHVPAVESFADKLLRISRCLIISVPFEWPSGTHPDHVHDPVDTAKVRSWFKRNPNYGIIVGEPIRPVPRLIAFFDQDDPARRTYDVHNRRPSRFF